MRLTPLRRREFPQLAALLACLLLTACPDGDAVERAPGPAPAAEADAGAAMTPASARPVARGVTGYYDLGDYFVLGEVVNDSDQPIYAVELEIEYRDGQGRVLATDEGAVPLSRVEPGATAPFVDTRYGAPEGIAQATVRVSRWSPESSLRYQPLTVLGTTARNGISGVVVTGQARNDSGRPLSSVKLVTSFRNAAGDVVGVYFDYPVTGSLPAGQTIDFTVETFDSTMDGHAVHVQGEGTAGG
jgi:hypothetical protein